MKSSPFGRISGGTMKKYILLTVIFSIICDFIGFATPIEIIEPAKWGDAGKVKKILEKNPDLVKVTDDEIGATALHWAAIYGKKEVIKIILGFSPDVNARERHEGTTMHWAAHFDDPEVIGWLLDHGAKIDHVNRFGRTPLLVAARRGCKSVIEILLKRGADIKAALGDGSTALHIAAKNGHTDVIEYLIAQGADSEIKNKQDQTYRDVLFKRPKTIKIEPDILHSCAGLYESSDRHRLDIREEDNHLYYYAFGKDELLPISQARFITSAEVKFFTFVKNPNGEVMEILCEIGDMEIRAKKIK